MSNPSDPTPCKKCHAPRSKHSVLGWRENETVVGHWFEPAPPEPEKPVTICPECDDRPIRTGKYSLCAKHDRKPEPEKKSMKQELLLGSDELVGAINGLSRATAMALFGVLAARGWGEMRLLVFEDGQPMRNEPWSSGFRGNGKVSYDCALQLNPVALIPRLDPKQQEAIAEALDLDCYANHDCLAFPSDYMKQIRELKQERDAAIKERDEATALARVRFEALAAAVKERDIAAGNATLWRNDAEKAQGERDAAIKRAEDAAGLAEAAVTRAAQQERRADRFTNEIAELRRGLKAQTENFYAATN